LHTSHAPPLQAVSQQKPSMHPAVPAAQTRQLAALQSPPAVVAGLHTAPCALRSWQVPFCAQQRSAELVASVVQLVGQTPAAPSQTKPPLHTGDPSLPTLRSVHVPGVALQRSHSPAQAVLQQKPSMQPPALPHTPQPATLQSLVALQIAPCTFFV